MPPTVPFHSLQSLIRSHQLYRFVRTQQFEGEFLSRFSTKEQLLSTGRKMVRLSFSRSFFLPLSLSPTFSLPLFISIVLSFFLPLSLFLLPSLFLSLFLSFLSSFLLFLHSFFFPVFCPSLFLPLSFSWFSLSLMNFLMNKNMYCKTCN